MAVAAAIRAGIRRFAGLHVTAPSSMRSQWEQLISDARNNETGLDVPEFTAASFRFVRVPDGATRLLLRTRTAKTGGISLDTAPIVRIIGIDSAPNADGTIDDGTIVTRVDLADSDGTGITVPLSASCYNDDLFYYGDIVSLDGKDVLGSEYIAIQVVTASVTSTPSQAVEILGRFLN